jgi:glycerol-3-phosphate dehydrogenase
MLDKRAAAISRLRSEQWDVLIVGGGINGAGIARDLVTRQAGLKVALVDKNHFSSGTSGRNSQLIHGGLRYLKYFDFNLVREALHERATLLRIAPELVSPLRFLLPCYRAVDRWFYGAGLTLYDMLAGSSSIGHHQVLDAARVARMQPGLTQNGLRAGLLFLDGRVHSARLVIENLVDAEKHGACVANYLSATLSPGPNGVAVEARDTLSGEPAGSAFEIRARRVVDATGAWSGAAPLRLVRGSHLIYPRIQHGSEAISYFDELGRIIFFIPWGERDDLTLVGTTDEDHAGGPDQVEISAREIAYLKTIVRRLFPDFHGDPVSSYSSLRPLLLEGGRSATATSREHKIWASGDGVLHVSGGKYTTYRAMSEELADLLLRDLAPGREFPCVTATTPLEIPARPEDPARVVDVAVRREYAQRLSDVLHVSTYWGHERRLDRAWLEPVARDMAGPLGWDEARIAREVDEVMRTLPPV